jgi:hypothetical protein
MWHLEEVAKMIQVRNVRPELHAELIRRARAEGMTLTAYVERILEREVSIPDPTETFRHLQRRRRTRRSRATEDEIVAIIRELRGPLPADA